MINPDDAREWQVLSDTEQARLRFSVMRELSWFDWDHRPAWWWAKEHATLLELKWACGRPRSLNVDGAQDNADARKHRHWVCCVQRNPAL